MKIDNSRANAFRKCPDFYRERYIRNLERNWHSADSPFDYGSRFHALLERHFKSLGGIPYNQPFPPVSEAIELECDAAFAAYLASYPSECFDVVAVEQSFEVAIPGSHHRYIGKFDGVIRYKENSDWPGQLAILEHKTEKRGAFKNLPKAWAARAQVSLYMWAAQQLYQEPFAHILLDVIRRQSPKGQEAVSFYRDVLERTVAQQEDAIVDIVYVADMIELLELEAAHEPHWPRNTDNCAVGNWECDYYGPHVVGDSPELIKLNFKSAKEYLDL
jgi:hypothetical protein